jgi:hypothetical protein
VTGHLVGPQLASVNLAMNGVTTPLSSDVEKMSPVPVGAGSYPPLGFTTEVTYNLTVQN